VDLAFAIRERLKELGLDQKGLALAAGVTESYISQLLTRKKAPPAPGRTDIYARMDGFLRLPPGELAAVAEAQRRAELKRKLGDDPVPLFQEVRALILRKCNPAKQAQVRPIFEAQPFGELERLVTQRLLDEVKRVARQELDNDDWLQKVAQLSNRSHEEMRVVVLEFLDTDIYHISEEHWLSFLDPLITSWDVDLATFGLEIVLHHRIAVEPLRRFEFVAQLPDRQFEEPGLREFLRDPVLSGDASQDEVEFLQKLRFESRRPTALYYYRELQNLRDPVHFRSA
jgi:transcriptional regulator with XRE-family HTH domain